MSNLSVQEIEAAILEKKTALDTAKKDAKALEDTRAEMVITLNELITESNQMDDEIRIIKSGNKTYKIKTRVAIGMIPVVLATGVGVSKMAKKNDKRIPPQEQVDQGAGNIQPPKSNEKVTEPPKEEQKEVSLPNCIPQSNLDGVSYKDIAEALGNMRDAPALQDTIMEMIMQGNILGIQKYLGMKENSEFTNNRATGKMNKATLDKLSNPFLMLDHNEILNNPNIPQDVKDAHNKFFNGIYPTNAVGYIIVSKRDMNEYLFTADHHLLRRYAVLTGSQRGNAQYQGSKNPTSPIGLYRLNDIRDDSKNYHAVDGPGRFFTLLPVDTKSNFNNAYDINQYAMGIHRLYYPTGSQYPKGYDEATWAARANALQSHNLSDRLQTHGCVMMGDIECGTFNDNIAVGDLGSFVCITE